LGCFAQSKRRHFGMFRSVKTLPFYGSFLSKNFAILGSYAQSKRRHFGMFHSVKNVPF
jgi:hypothetical protein